MPPSGLHAMRKLLGIKPQEADVLLESAAKSLLRKIFDSDQVVCVPEMVHLRDRKFKWLLRRSVRALDGLLEQINLLRIAVFLESLPADLGQ